ncbi:hypothetical protein BDW62DRAFT_182239 [Aspergillus aurantiobrunneus]
MDFPTAVSNTFTVLIVYPVYYVAFAAYFVLGLAASPFIYLGFLGLWLILLPLRFLISLKALLIYLGVASLAGAIIALFVYSMTTATIEVLSDYFSITPTATRLDPRLRSHVIKDAEDLSLSDWTNWSWGPDVGPLKKKEPVSETIMEEESQGSEL